MPSTLYLIPTPIAENAEHTLPLYVVEIVQKLDVFIVERAKTARAYLKLIGHPLAMNDIDILEIPRDEIDTQVSPTLKEKFLLNKNVGIMSEAGCPGVADPGATIVNIARSLGFQIVAEVGPSSILLALMASGFSGQSFHFHGYLSNKKPILAQELKQIEKSILHKGDTHIFIEAPYRNEFLLEQICNNLNPQLWLNLSIDLNSNNESHLSHRIGAWKNLDFQQFHKRPAVFLLGRKQ